MTNQLTQAELINLATEAGILGHRVAGYGDGEFIYFTQNDEGLILTETLAKFAQLIQQRQGVDFDRLAGLGRQIERARECEPALMADALTEIGKQIYLILNNAGISGAELLHSPTAPQLVAQALEKAVSILEAELVTDPECGERIKEQWNHIVQGFIDKIRALIDQPVEPVLDDNVEEIIRTSFKQGFALGSGIGAEYTPLAKSCEDALVGAWLGGGKFNSSPPVEQGGDELMGLLPEKKVFLPNSLIGDDANKFMEGMVNGFNDCLEQVRQALANRRGGE